MTAPRFEILRRDPVAGGACFGDAGAYERLAGRVHFAIDPAAPAQQGVFDIALAPRDADGLVRFDADVWLLQPVDPARANRRLFFDLLNRGNKRAIQFFNDGQPSNDPLTTAEAGNGFLMRRGYTLCAIAWQGDVLPGDGRMTLRLPVARQADAAPVTGRIRVEFIVDRPGIACLPLSGKQATHSYPAVSLDTAQAMLVRRRYPDSPAEPIAPDAWAFALLQGGGRAPGAGDISGAEQGLVPSATHITLHAGFRPGWIYQLTYTARDPLLLDLGFVAVRDGVGALRDGGGGVLRAPIEKAYCWGRSQSGRAIRDILHRGFNADASGRRVFDGMLPHISGAGKTTMNRFTNLVIAASRQYEDHLNPADRFPFSYAPSTDHLTGRRDAILKRPETDPLVIHTQSASEYWQRRGSLVHTDTQGNDLPQPETVRLYSWVGSQHWADPLLKAPSRGNTEHLPNVVATSAFFRATLDLLDGWASHGRAPPPSRVPNRADGTLVPYAEWRSRFPAIPGAALPQSPNLLRLIDYGPEFDRGREIAEPPVLHDDLAYAVLVPRCDADGNDEGGLRAPMVQAPLGTYTGWNIRIRGHGAGCLHDFVGSYLPLADTPEERLRTGDPRPSILERYGTRDAYASAIRMAAERLASEGFLLAEDVERADAAARDWGRPRHDVRLGD
jgi:hypothetical protein